MNNMYIIFCIFQRKKKKYNKSKILINLLNFYVPKILKYIFS